MSAQDEMLAGYQAELEEKTAFQGELAAGARAAGRDLNGEEAELYNRANARMEQLVKLMAPLRESVRIATESRARMEELSTAYTAVRSGALECAVEYRSAGAYIADVYFAGIGSPESQQRIATYNRAAAHQVTSDNPGLLPVSIVEPVINLVDAARPIVSALGPTDLGTGSWAYARVTQHTLVAQQTAEKAEMASRKMTISTTPITAPTLGGYVNVSKQNINRTSPQILDMVINDLATEYAIESEKACGAALIAGGTADGTIPTGADGAAVAKVLWGAAAAAYNGMRGAGRLVLAVSPDLLGVVGPLFAPVNPTNSQSSGFAAGSFGQGAMGAISGITTVMSSGLPAGTMLVINSAAVRVFEMRYGAMQVNEPSVWGVQVGYAGDFQTVVIEATGVQKVTVTP